MIENKVVLILGAGASMPYGFSSGAELKNKVQDLGGNSAFQDSFFPGKFDKKLFESFRIELAQSPFMSIDAFLEARHADYLQIGKHTIAYLLMSHESPDIFLPRCIDAKEDWYRYLFNLMLSDGLDSFRQNNLSIITFNYDRSFEFYLIRGLMANYKLPFGEAKTLLESIPIVHVYGKLGELSDDDSEKDSRAFEPICTPKLVERGAGGIKIISEISTDHQSPDMQGFSIARGLFMDADHLVFLGFGFHPANVTRLTIGAILSDEDKDRILISGTTMGLTDSEFDVRVQPLFILENIGIAKLEKHDSDCLNFIRNNLNIFVRELET